MYVDQTLTNALFLWRESVLSALQSDQSPCEIASDLEFYEGVNRSVADQVVELVQGGE
jgi:hypothetical protein